MRHMEARAMKESVETILDLTGLFNDRLTLSKDLSGGMKRRLSIGMSMIGDPKVKRRTINSIISVVVHSDPYP